MKHTADVHKLIAELQNTLWTVASGSDHACRPHGCKVCAARGRVKDEQARAERRAGKTYGPAPEGVDPFRGFR